MSRYLLTVSYDGTAYAGWQRQKNGTAVQEKLEDAMQSALRVRTPVTGASRTDAGVHALGQRAHFDAETSIPADKFPFVLNRFLPYDIRVLGCEIVPDDFHARFCTKDKTYTYRIHNAVHASALYRNLTAHIPVPLDAGRMHEAAQTLVGTHDFAAFAAAGGSAKTTVRTIEEISVSRAGEEITLVVRGNAFLYNMVRIIAGTLIYIGQGKLPPECLREALDTGSRLALGITAPAQGLELTHISYREERQQKYGLSAGDSGKCL